MKRTILAVAAVSGTLVTAPAIAAQRCNVPMAMWQPREVLLEKLNAEGWKVTRIKTDDGCYKVYAGNDRGERLERKFDPATLQPMKMDIEHRRDDHD